MILKPEGETHSWNTSYNHCTYLNSDYFFGRSLLSLALFYDLQIFGGLMSKRYFVTHFYMKKLQTPNV